MKTINSDFIKEIHANAKEKGFWDKEKTFGDIVSLIHSELSEALEFERNKNNLKKDGVDYLKHYSAKIHFDLYGNYGDFESSYTTLISNSKTDICKKPDGLIFEMADAVIRVFDYIGSLGLEDSFIEAIMEKHEYNKTRSFMHGGKTL